MVVGDDIGSNERRRSESDEESGFSSTSDIASLSSGGNGKSKLSSSRKQK